MSQENVEVVRRAWEAFADHRFPDELLDERFEWTTHPNLPDAGTYRGRDVVRAFFAAWVPGWA
jgi:ketosteroid isomerase-like protein